MKKLSLVLFFIILLLPINVRAFSEDQVYQVAQLIKAESEGESEEGQYAVATVFKNRYELWGMVFGKTFDNILYDAGQFTPTKNKKWFKKIEPTERHLEIARDVLLNGNTNLPQYVCFFQKDSYHHNPYKQIGNHYFSYRDKDMGFAEEYTYAKCAEYLTNEYFADIIGLQESFGGIENAGDSSYTETEFSYSE